MKLGYSVKSFFGFIASYRKNSKFDAFSQFYPKMYTRSFAAIATTQQLNTLRPHNFDSIFLNPNGPVSSAGKLPQILA